MNDIILTAIIAGSALLSWHMWLTFKAGGFGPRGARGLWAGCPCGHAASFHKDGGGCKHTHNGSTNCYGYCTCPRSRRDVEGMAADDHVSV